MGHPFPPCESLPEIDYFGVLASAKMRNNMAAGWFYSPEQIKRYILTRPTSLKPPRTKLRNPVAVLKELDRHQWLMFLAGFLGWTWDAFGELSSLLQLSRSCIGCAGCWEDGQVWHARGLRGPTDP
jgi:hypothetical protein